MKENIVLIGFMGVGKGRTARELAGRTGMFAVDCDDLIESYANMKVKAIFDNFGEGHFRKLERNIALWLEKRVTGTIVSTGGGFFKVPNIDKIGKVVYLHGEFDAIIAAIQAHPNAKKKIKKRPLLQNLDQARDLYNERLGIYKKTADVIISVDGKTEREVAKEIIKQLGLKK